MRNVAVLVILSVFFAGYAFSAARMEHLRANGTEVLLPLAPVDPRALLMGDYMALDYAVNRAIAFAVRNAPDDAAETGRAVVRLSPVRDRGESGADAVRSRREAVFVRLDDGALLADDEIFLRYKVRGRTVITAAPAFYFQEGHAAAYEQARFGRVMVDPDGATLLVTLCNDQGADIVPAGEEEH